MRTVCCAEAGAAAAAPNAAAIVSAARACRARAKMVVMLVVIVASPVSPRPAFVNGQSCCKRHASMASKGGRDKYARPFARHGDRRAGGCPSGPPCLKPAFAAHVLACDRREHEAEADEAQDVDPALVVLEEVERDGDALAGGEEQERDAEDREQRVAGAPPEAEEEQRRHQEARGVHAGEEGRPQSISQMKPLIMTACAARFVVS